MTISERPLTANQWIIAIVALAGLCFVAVHFVTSNPWPFIILGALAVIASFLLPKSALEGEYINQGGSGMGGLEMINKWDELQIKTAVRTTLATQGVDAVHTLLSGILSRFIDGQNSQTFAERTAFLKTQIDYVATWTELKVAVGEAERTAKKEGQKDKRLGIDDKAIDHELELSDIKHDVEMENLREKLDEIKYRRSTIGKEPPITPPPPAPPSAEEVRAKRIAELRTREANLLAEKKRADENTNLTEDQRQRIHNNIDDQLARVYEELAELL